jgi:hypothetical protein
VLVFVHTYARRRTPRCTTEELTFLCPNLVWTQTLAADLIIIARKAMFLTVTFCSQNGVPAA